MLLRDERIIALRSELVVFDIAVLVDAVGDVVGRQIGNAGECLRELGGRLLLLRVSSPGMDGRS